MQRIFTFIIWVSFLLLFIPFKSFSQKNFTQAYLILPSQDSVQGLIDDQNWGKNPKVISFKKDESSVVQKYKPSDILGFGLRLGEQYSSQIVLVDKSPTDLASLLEVSEQTSNFIVQDTVFLTQLVKGYTNLYYLKDENAKVHFYAQKLNNPITELIQAKSITNVKGKYLVVTSDTYKSQLINLLADCLALHSEINKVNFRQNDLIHLIEKYNNLKSGVTNQITPIKSEANILFGLVAGVSQTNLTFSGQYTNSKLVDNKFETTVNYILGLHLDFIMDRNRRKWSMHNELAWKPYKTQASYEFTKSADNYEKGIYKLGFGYVGVANLLRYTWPLAHLKPFINAGIAQNIALTSVNSHNKTTHFYAPDQESTTAVLADYRKYEQALVVGAGVTSNRISGEIRLEKGNGMSAYTALKSSKQMIQVLLSYRLN
ncbi:outer membrane beta-barrel protein [Adhaeribacter radiodurans]|uniref:PorT family protein n=1 Tax=Adhaeribacter radiodurans TaxID=2745197 RepID=A0A7L7L706_9BACT|nr:outer membrane beta-barrel protein [Adhaeribacter radiodurans]QMU28534.1 PorT family protein [Adhaeribacter radiodurans]